MNKFWGTTLIGLLIFTSIVWAGYVFYKSQNEISLNPKADSYITPIEDTFDEVTLRKFEVSVAKQDISPDHFFNLESLE